MPAGEEGASLVEILVASAIIASALAILTAALSTGAFGVRSANRTTTATRLAASQLESIRADAYDDVVGGRYSRVALPPSYATLVTTNTINTGLLQVTVTVSHRGEMLVELSNYKTDR